MSGDGGMWGGQWQQRLDRGEVCVAVIGLGYVGLPLLRSFFDAGLSVLGFDVDPEKIPILKAGKNYIAHLGDDFVSHMAGSPRFDATDDPTRLAEADALIICVPTPLGPHLEPDLGYVEATTRDIAAILHPGQLVVLESTTYPGTTRDVVLPRLQTDELVCGRDFFLAYSPEREDPGNAAFATNAIPKLLGGIDDASADAGMALYQKAFQQMVRVSSAEVAEAAKLHENIYRAVNIALANEMKVVLSEMGIDVFEVIEAAATKPFGFHPFYPGPGLGGHCIPIDPFYLTWKAREMGQATRFIELAGEINRGMPAYVVGRCVHALNQHRKAINGAKLLILGVAYKTNVADLRESPAFEIIEQLLALGADVDYCDPHVPHTPRVRRYNIEMSSITLSEEAIARYDAVVIATAHDAFDWEMIFRFAKLVVDSRGVRQQQNLPPSPHIVSA